ncbi:MAG TPA: agmatine deiminase family protein [Pirellulales bacterium]|jgi:agmatine/peptidylarginine deiminase|nr:agmatine deiminase family protein [Pirellulales bacterium]
MSFEVDAETRWYRTTFAYVVLSALTSTIISLGFAYWLGGGRSIGTRRSMPPVQVVRHEPRPVPPEADAQARIPGAFEHQDALLLGCNELVQYHPETMVQIVGEIYDRIRLIGLVNNEDQRDKTIQDLEDHDLPADAIHFVILPLEGMWVQDYGPIFLKMPDHRVKMIDFQYLPREVDDRVNMMLAERFKIDRDFVPLALEGGNILSNGRGLGLTTAGMIQVNLSRGHTMDEIKTLLRDRFAFNTVSVLKMLHNEPTGHVDLFAALLAPDTVVVGDYAEAVDAENSKILDENAAQLSKIVTAVGPMKVTRIPMPTNAGGVWRTYTNVIFANGKLLVPQYPQTDPTSDAAALSIYRALLPDWEVVGIDCTSLIVKHGALHCISLNVPWLPDADAL